ncbi:hypothetical protein SD81_009835 [Tolypothrix campylonemoides VB511288]|nr:hypothetical protein SD81_009835 [Tolypothrix campylonemoides VB511288]
MIPGRCRFVLRCDRTEYPLAAIALWAAPPEHRLLNSVAYGQDLRQCDCGERAATAGRLRGGHCPLGDRL